MILLLEKSLTLYIGYVANTIFASLSNKSLILYSPRFVDLKRERVKIDWVRMLEVSECSNILFLVTSSADSFIRKYILETAVLLYLYHGVALSICHQITFFIFCLSSFQTTLISSCFTVHLTKELLAQRFFLPDPSRNDLKALI
jgi:hypothetical protein